MPVSREPLNRPDEQLLVGYVLNALEPDERRFVEDYLVAHPEAIAQIQLIRNVLQPLEADRDGYDPPPGLALATIARTAEYIVENQAEPQTPIFVDSRPKPSIFRQIREDGPIFSLGWRRTDVIVAAGIAFMAFGLFIAGVGKLRQGRDVAACQENMHELHTSLTNYAETHQGRFPEVGSREVPVAGAFVEELTRTGNYTSAHSVACPAAVPIVGPSGSEGVTPVGYAYTLGYIGANGKPIGFRRTEDNKSTSDWSPIMADLPTAQESGLIHAKGQNVLYAGGMVRFTTTSLVGVNRDEIYHNEAGFVRAGLHRDDAALGRPTDVP